MTPNDIAAAAERVRRANETDIVAVYGHYKIGSDANDYRQKYGADLATLADAYLALADPTPLTVEVLVGMGGVEDGEHIIDFAGFNVFHGGEPETWLWDKPFSGESLMLSPRTVGELRQLLQRLEPPHATS